ncbi:MAG: V-type ATP synthase subunit I [Spirochaetes bacterium]|nr:V-type ATP synthase subunit I [Spirochaetota bacterium]
MSATTMRRMEILLLKSDIDEVLRCLSSLGCFQIIYPEEPAIKAARPRGQTSEAGIAESERLDTALSRLGKLGSCLGLHADNVELSEAHLPDEALFSRMDELYAFCSKAEDEERSLRLRLGELEESLRETRAFVQLGMPFEDIDKLSFVTMRIGTVDPQILPALENALEGRAVIIPTDDKGSILAVGSKRGRFALDTELSKAGFSRMELPATYSGVPAEAISSLEKAYTETQDSLAEVAVRKAEKTEELSASWSAISSSMRLGKALKRVEKRLEGTEWAFRLSGWVPAADSRRVVSALSALLGERAAIRIFDPEDEETAEEKDNAKVPVLLKQNSLVSAFSGIVLSYGTPLYGDVDPTPFVAFFFTLLFSIMFGDLGQGAVILLIGILASRATKGLLGRYRQYGPAFMAAGMGAMFMGLLVGSCFSDEYILAPVERFLTGLILGSPKDRFLDIMPQDSLSSMFYFFGFTVGIGILINSTGLVINMINLIRRGKKGKAIFSKTGLSGALLFWWAIGMGVRAILGSRLGWWDALGLGIPLVALFFADPLARLIDGKEAGDERPSLIDILVGGIVEIIEAFSYYASNTMSFLRVGAFALAHGVLSFVVFTMGELVRSRAPGGIFFEILIFLIGNIVILVLEGLIVTIQVIRLQYYEFFSKFFTQTGKAFEPMRFEP